VVVVGGSENGGADAGWKNERRSRPLRNQPKLENRNSKIETRNRKTENQKAKKRNVKLAVAKLIFKLLAEKSESEMPNTQN
jgi:hypothetical protein